MSPGDGAGKQPAVGSCRAVPVTEDLEQLFGESLQLGPLLRGHRVQHRLHGGHALGHDLEQLIEALGVLREEVAESFHEPVEVGLFAAFALAFAIKVPLWPLHTWLPDAHVEAPTAGSVVLAGVLLKMGTYGILRICYPILPDAAKWFALPLAILGAINIIYGAFCALAQTDMKKLVAYSSVSPMPLLAPICSAPSWKAVLLLSTIICKSQKNMA